MVLTVVAMSGILVSPTHAAAQAGDLIKKAGLSTVYYLGNDGKRYVFPSQDVYFSWYSDFSGVVTVSASELSSYPLGSNVVMRAGTKLVKITSDPSVYAVEPNGVLRKINSEADAVALFGANWASRVVDVADSFFTNYTVGSTLASGEVPVGSLVKDGADIFVYDGSSYRKFNNEAALSANRYMASYAITKSVTASGTMVTGYEEGLAKTSQSTSTGTVITSSGVTVAVSANTAPASTIVATQALASLGSFNFTASNDGSAMINTLKIKRTGISSDTAFDNVYLFDGTTKLTDGASFSNGYVSFSSGNGLITVPAGQTKTITVKADVSSLGTSGTVGVSIDAASDITASASTISGSFPLMGNLMSMTSASGMAKVALATSTTATTMKAGNTNSIVWSATAAVANKAVDFKHIAFKQIGSINADDLENLSLYVDGTKVATAMMVNNDLNFDFNAVNLNTGSHTIDLKADIIKGSSRTFSFSMQTAANAVFTDTNYNVNVVATGAALTAAPSFTISTGTLSLSADTTFNTTEIVKTATNATLAKFKLKAFGEDVKVNTLSTLLTATANVGLSATSTETVSDYVVYVDGTQVGSSKTVTFASGTATYADTFGTNNLFTIAAGHEAVVEIKGSLTLDTNTVLSTLRADITGLTAQGVTSYATVASVNANGSPTLSVTSGSLTPAKNTAMQDQNVSKNSQAVKIGSFILSTGSAEGANVSNIRINMAGTADYANNMSNLYISDNTTPISPASSNDFNVNFNVPANSNHTVDVYADLGEIATGSTTAVTLGVTYRTSVTNTFANTNATPVSGQTLTIQTGTLATPTLVADAPSSNFVLGGTTATAGTYKFVATNGTAYLNEMTFTVNSAVTAMSQITVDGKSSPVVGSSVTITGLNTAIAPGLQGVSVPVLANYNPITSTGNGGIATAATSTLTLTGYKYTVNGTQSTVTGASISTNEMKGVSAYPTVANAQTYSNTTLTTGAKTEVMRFSVTNTGTNPINLGQISLTPSFDYVVSTTTSNDRQIQIEDASNLGTNLATSTAKFLTDGTVANVSFVNNVVVNGTKTFVVYVNNTGTTATGNYFRMDMSNSGWLWDDSTIANPTITGTHIKEFSGTTFSK